MAGAGCGEVWGERGVAAAPGDRVWGRDWGFQRDLMGVALGGVKGALSSLQDPVHTVRAD